MVGASWRVRDGMITLKNGDRALPFMLGRMLWALPSWVHGTRGLIARLTGRVLVRATDENSRRIAAYWWGWAEDFSITTKPQGQ